MPQEANNRLNGLVVVSRSRGERIGPAPTGSDPTANILDLGRLATKLSLMIDPSVHLFAPASGAQR